MYASRFACCPLVTVSMPTGQTDGRQTRYITLSARRSQRDNALNYWPAYT